MSNPNTEDEVIVTLQMEDGTTVECLAILLFQKSGKEYVALVEKEFAEDEEAEVFFYRYREDEEGNGILECIEDDDEYEFASDAYDEYLDTLAFEEMQQEEQN